MDPSVCLEALAQHALPKFIAGYTLSMDPATGPEAPTWHTLCTDPAILSETPHLVHVPHHGPQSLGALSA
jgi:hypothetical protein